MNNSIEDNLPQKNVKEYIQQLAQDNSLVYQKTKLDELAVIFTEHSGDDVHFDATQDLLVALYRAKVINARQMAHLCIYYMREQKTLNQTSKK